MTINDPMLWRLIWKEYRAQRAFWLVVAGCAMGLMVFLLTVVPLVSDRSFSPYLITWFMPMLYAWGCTATLFATEAEEGTWELLRVLAATPARVFAAKAGFLLVSTAGMIGLLLLLAWGLSPGTTEASRIELLQIGFAKFEVEEARSLRMVCLYGEIVAWGLLFSALVQRVLTAVCLGAGASFTSLLLIDRPFINRPLEYFWGYALIVLPAMVVLSYGLVQRRLSGRSLRWSLPLYGGRQETLELDRLAAARETSPAGLRLLQRLLWQEWRQAPRAGLAAWGAIAVLMFVVGYPFRDLDRQPFALPGLTVISLLMGVWAFRAEQEGCRFRFLADRGIAPWAVWLSKQLVWLPLTIVAAAPFMLMFIIVDVSNNSLQYPGWLLREIRTHNVDVNVRALALVCVCLNYAVGQFFSMLIARTITAGFVGLIVSSFLIVWLLTMTALHVPLGISVMLPVVILLAATLAWSRNWLLERHTWWRWLRFLGAVGFAMASVWGSVGVYRVYEVPEPAAVRLPPVPVSTAAGAALFGPVTPEEAETAAIYARAFADLKSFPTSNVFAGIYSDGKPNGLVWQDLTATDRQFLAENEAVLQRAIVATQRATCTIVDPSRADCSRLPDSYSYQKLCVLFLLSARKLESEQNLDEALERYVSALRLARHVSSRGGLAQYHLCVGIENAVYIWMPYWAVHPAQTSERIHGALHRVAAETSQFSSSADVIRIHERPYRIALENDSSMPADEWSTPTDEFKSDLLTRKTSLIRHCLPWERLRAVRLLNLLTATELRIFKEIELSLANCDKNVRHRYRLADEAFEEAVSQSLLAATPEGFRFPHRKLYWFFDPVVRELARRGFVLRMALIAWKKRHGSLPERLSDLAGNGLDVVPCDPWTGEEFNYRPRGFPAPVTLGRHINANEPVLWSSGFSKGYEVDFRLP